ncbi:DNA polymerase epsilon subunit 4 isoform 1-T2 [Cochliomyia hominivorax]
MSSEDLFEEDFSEELITELEQEYVLETVNTDHEANAETEQNLEASSGANVEVNKDGILIHIKLLIYCYLLLSLFNLVSKRISTPNDSKLFQLPLTRIRNIMKLDPDLHIASNEAVFLVTRATEKFIESLAQESYNFTVEAKKKTVQKRDVDLAMDAVDSLMFLDGAMTF